MLVRRWARWHRTVALLDAAGWVITLLRASHVYCFGRRTARLRHRGWSGRRIRPGFAITGCGRAGACGRRGGGAILSVVLGRLGCEGIPTRGYPCVSLGSKCVQR